MNVATILKLKGRDVLTARPDIPLMEIAALLAVTVSVASLSSTRMAKSPASCRSATSCALLGVKALRHSMSRSKLA